MDTVPEDATAEAPEVEVVVEGAHSVLRPQTRRSSRLNPFSPAGAEGSEEHMTASKGAGRPSPDTIDTSGRGGKVIVEDQGNHSALRRPLCLHKSSNLFPSVASIGDALRC